MSKQIFKQDISKNIFLNFLEKNAHVTDKFFIFSKTNYRQANYHNANETLCELIRPCYHVSKLHYIERKLTYSKFMTILRQLCKATGISYTSRIVYANSTYNIIYYIVKDS